VSLLSFKGRPVILWFMAAWCPTCVRQSDAITKVKSEFGNKIDLLVIDMWTIQAIGSIVQGFVILLPYVLGMGWWWQLYQVWLASQIRNLTRYTQLNWLTI
jgi:thiol-disulfide isomerase/thioredoxin